VVALAGQLAAIGFVQTSRAAGLTSDFRKTAKSTL
jgi:hypothetical protein